VTLHFTLTVNIFTVFPLIMIEIFFPDSGLVSTSRTPSMRRPDEGRAGDREVVVADRLAVAADLDVQDDGRRRDVRERHADRRLLAGDDG